MKPIIFITLLSFASCNMRTDHVQEFVVPEYNEMYLRDSIKYLPYDYYVQNNLMVHSSEKKFYYHDNWTKCGTDWKVTDPPRPIDFERYPLTKYEEINDVLHEINKKENSIKLVIIASLSDTIRNDAYFELKNAIKAAKDIHVVATRKTTDDEDKAIENNFIINKNESSL